MLQWLPTTMTMAPSELHKGVGNANPRHWYIVQHFFVVGVQEVTPGHCVDTLHNELDTMRSTVRFLRPRDRSRP